MNNIEVMGLFLESEDTAATSRSSQFSHALETILRTRAKLLLVESIADLADTVQIQEILIDAARQCGAEVVSIRKTSGCEKEKTQVRTALRFLNQWQQKIVTARLCAARVEARAGNGRREGRKPYGFPKDQEQALHERKVLFQMRELRNGGMSFGKIAERLNRDGLQPRKGRCWWGKTISLILRHAEERKPILEAKPHSQQETALWEPSSAAPPGSSLSR